MEEQAESFRKLLINQTIREVAPYLQLIPSIHNMIFCVAKKRNFFLLCHAYTQYHVKQRRMNKC